MPGRALHPDVYRSDRVNIDSPTLIAVVIIAALAGAGAAWGLLRLRGRGGRPDPLFQQQLGDMKLELGRVTELVRELEKDRENKFGELTARLRLMGEQTASLNTTTGALREALASTRARGQWGERMAEDVLRLVGFVDGVNYVKQKSLGYSSARPDFTFLLPNSLKLNMDVKFPLENYLRYTAAQEPGEQERCRTAFLRDVRVRLKEVATRDYIDPQQSTLGCVLLFIPNEQIYQFIHEQDQSLLDEALKQQVIVCSPATLFAVLVVVRQAVDNFTIQQTSNEVIRELGLFQKQWEEFLKKLQDLGRRIDSTQREYQTLVTTRRRALDRPLERIEMLRRQRGLEPAEDFPEADSEPVLPDLDTSLDTPDGAARRQ
jgi:DNA recombination protein RmuC